MAAADSPASAPRRDYQVARFGANPPRHLVELRANRSHATSASVDAASRAPYSTPRHRGQASARSLEAIYLDVG